MFLTQRRPLLVLSLILLAFPSFLGCGGDSEEEVGTLLNWDWDPRDPAGNLPSFVVVEEHDAQIIRVETKMVGKTGDGWAYSYRFTLKNNTEQTWRVTIYLEWWDEDDFVVASETLYDVLLTANSEDTMVGGSAVIPFGVAPSVRRPAVRWEWRAP